MVGIGFRKDFAHEFLEEKILKPDFIEVAPENWMGIGGNWKRIFKQVTEKHPLFCHGLSLSLGSPDKLDKDFLAHIKDFLEAYNVKIYSEHLSFTKCDNAHLYDLLPIPFTKDAVKHVSNRIQEAQDFLDRKIAMEIASYYTPIAAEMEEIEFVSNVIEQADCQLLLDVNNIYVNSFNHNYNPKEYIKQLPLDKVTYIHMAGHEKVAEDLIIDTHGQAIIDPVYDLFEYTMQLMPKDVPVLLERDFNIPELEELHLEMNQLRAIKQKTVLSHV